MDVEIQLFERYASKALQKVWRKDTLYIQGVSGGIVNILGDGNMDYSE